MPRALLISGSPNSRKTTSLFTWAKAARPGVVHIVTCPREEGWETIPTNDPLIKSHVDYCNYNPAGGDTDWTGIVAAVKQRCAEIIAGKHGPASTLALDGLHKYFECVLGACTNGGCFKGEGFNGILVYPKAQNMAAELMYLLKRSSLNYVVFTCWDGYEKDREIEQDRMEGSKIVQAERHKWPDLPGKMAKRVIGMVSTVHASVQGSMARWQVLPAGDVQGCGLKRPPDIMAQFKSPFVNQSWPELEAKMYPNDNVTGFTNKEVK